MKSRSEETRFQDVFDKIKRYYQDEIKYPLTPELEAELKRWKIAREYILTMNPLTDSSVVNHLVGLFKISEPQAWRDVRNTKRFFVSMETTNREFDRTVLVANIRDLRVKAELAGDLRVVAQCNATLAKMGVGEEAQVETNTGKHIEILIGFNPKLIGAKENPNLLQEVAKFIGEEQARRELMVSDDETI